MQKAFTSLEQMKKQNAQLIGTMHVQAQKIRKDRDRQDRLHQKRIKQMKDKHDRQIKINAELER